MFVRLRSFYTAYRTALLTLMCIGRWDGFVSQLVGLSKKNILIGRNDRITCSYRTTCHEWLAMKKNVQSVLRFGFVTSHFLMVNMIANILFYSQFIFGGNFIYLFISCSKCNEGKEGEGGGWMEWWGKSVPIGAWKCKDIRQDVSQTTN